MLLYAIPQFKEGFFVCFRKDLGISEFNFPTPTKTNSRLIDFLETDINENFKR